MSSKQAILLRKPSAQDGSELFQLIQNCPPLDMNSMYCNLLQCSHFADTSVAAEMDGQLVGFISGYLLPGSDTTLFIWQVAVSEQARGRGLATDMLDHLLSREYCSSVTHVHTTITEDNKASWALFHRLARELKTELKRSVMFDRDRHFKGSHDTEYLASIGPFQNR
jgi:L-2,4-diaminobutyric acid acetyltransferase